MQRRDFVKLGLGAAIAATLPDPEDVQPILSEFNVRGAVAVERPEFFILDDYDGRPLSNQVLQCLRLEDFTHEIPDWTFPVYRDRSLVETWKDATS